MSRLHVHKSIYTYGTTAFAFGIFFGPVTGSIPQLVLGLNWILEGQFSAKWQRIKTQTWFWAALAYWVWLCCGILYSNRMNLALEQVKIQLPLCSWALIFMSSEALDLRALKRVLWFFLAGLVCSFVYGIAAQFYVSGILDLRKSARFMSHIRFSQFQILGFFAALMLWQNAHTKLSRLIWILAVITLLLVITIAGNLSSLVFLLVAFLLLIFQLQFSIQFKKQIVYTFLLLLFSACGVLYWMYSAYFKIKPLYVNQLINQSRSGRPLIHFAPYKDSENGVYIYQNIQMEELRREWNLKCPEDSFSYNPAYNLKRYEVLIRYLSSLAEIKDSAGVSQLKPQDISMIKAGYHFRSERSWPPLWKRFYELLREGRDIKQQNPNSGHSLSMRFLFWKTAISAYGKCNIWTGTGPGDLEDDMLKIYAENHAISSEWYKKPHQQFITVLLSSGLMGLLCFGLFIAYPAVHFSFKQNLFMPFWVILILGFTYEDTLNSQAGVCLWIFWMFWVWQYNALHKAPHLQPGKM